MRCTVKDNQAEGRYELEEAGQVAFARYHRMGDILYIDHVQAPAALQGTGTAGRLMQGMMEHIHSEGCKVVPVCSYAAAWLARHAEFDECIAHP